MTIDSTVESAYAAAVHALLIGRIDLFASWPRLACQMQQA